MLWKYPENLILKHIGLAAWTGENGDFIKLSTVIDPLMWLEKERAQRNVHLLLFDRSRENGMKNWELKYFYFCRQIKM